MGQISVQFDSFPIQRSIVWANTISLTSGVPSLNRTDLRALTLIGLTGTSLVLDPLAVVGLDNLLSMTGSNQSCSLHLVSSKKLQPKQQQTLWKFVEVYTRLWISEYHNVKQSLIENDFKISSHIIFLWTFSHIYNACFDNLRIRTLKWNENWQLQFGVVLYTMR